MPPLKKNPHTYRAVASGASLIGTKPSATKPSPKNHTMSEKLALVQKYLAGDMRSSACAKQLDCSRQTFYSLLKHFHALGYLRFRAPLIPDKGNALSSALNPFRKEQRSIESFVVRAQPGEFFGQGAGEALLPKFLKGLRSPSPMFVIGVCGGGSVRDAVQEMFNETLIREIVPEEHARRKKVIFLLALNNTWSSGSELATSPGVIVANMAEAAKRVTERMFDKTCPPLIHPMNLSADFAVTAPMGKTHFLTPDGAPANSRIIALTDPDRLRELDRSTLAANATTEREHDMGVLGDARLRLQTITDTHFGSGHDLCLTEKSNSNIDLLITGVGTTQGLLFKDVWREFKLDEVDPEIIGDIGNTNITVKGKVKYMKMGDHQMQCYSAIDLEILKSLVRMGKDVALVARNTPEKLPKTDVMLVAIRQLMCSTIITDEVTAEDLMARVESENNSESRFW